MTATSDTCGQAADQWLAVSTHPHRERAALENLVRQGFAPYCPMIAKRVRHARQSREVMRPLFPGYVFVRYTPGVTIWRPILSTIGVRALVRFGDKLATLEQGFIDGLRSRECDGAIVRPAEPYQVGQQVRIADGAFENLVATIIGLDERDRLILLMDLLNNKIKVKVDARGVAAV